MKKNFPVTQTQHAVPDNCELVSGTDLKGIIRYANDSFVEISGFTHDELVGKNHNIVRHPDVPPLVFADAWQTLKRGQAWMGIVKNRCKNGDFYWVDAYITPVSEQGRVVGYESVRRKASSAQIQRAEYVYQRLNQGKPLTPRWRPSSQHQHMLMVSSVGWIPLLVGVLTGQLSLPIFGFGSLLVLLTSYYVARGLLAEFKPALSMAQGIINNPAIQYMYTGKLSLGASLEMATIAMRARLRTVLGRIHSSGVTLDNHAHRCATLATSSQKSIAQQQLETDQVATAISQMSSTIQQIAGSTQLTAKTTEAAKQQTDQGRGIVEQTIAAINQLSSAVEGAHQSVSHLLASSDEIGGMLDVIRDVAEQTNLLALNAAIEAARAGESGRGFAVVADEVRTLAQRTRQSTEQIQQIITTLQKGAQLAADAIINGQQHAQASVKSITQAGESLQHISGAAQQITQMSIEIASAAHQQSVVTQEISANIRNIANLSAANAQDAVALTMESKQLTKLADEQTQLVARFQQ